MARSVQDSISHKHARFRNGSNLRVLDLFSGCGGLSLGFHKSGYSISANIELDKDAASSHAMNFHRDDSKFAQFAEAKDITKITADQLVSDLGLNDNKEMLIDVIIGGPPCQAFTRIGRAKLRETYKDSKAFLKDARSQLYKTYLNYVKEFKPLAVLMENVPDMLNYGGINIADLACDDLTSLGYECKYTILNTAHFGVPQMRERVFIIGVHKKINPEISFPVPSHYVELPKGYHGSRNVAMKVINSQSDHKYFTPSPEALKTLQRALSAKDALSDLPRITEHLQGKIRKEKRRLDTAIAYETEEWNTDFQRVMRSWPGFETNGTVTANVIRYLPRDFAIFKRMAHGDQYPEALQIAKKLFEAKLKSERRLTGVDLSQRGKKYKMIFKETVPPYDVNKFPNKWRKMEDDKPARTLMAHLGKDSYSHIHYDSKQARTISVREAARLQTFPDGFHFSGSMNSALRQIGNAVPPLMAEKLAIVIKKILSAG